jgi:hypothetical protein
MPDAGWLPTLILVAVCVYLLALIFGSKYHIKESQYDGYHMDKNNGCFWVVLIFFLFLLGSAIFGY